MWAVLQHQQVRGGQRQRSSSSTHTVRRNVRSKLAELLLEQRGYGLLSARQVQRVAMAALDDIEISRGRPLEPLIALAKHSNYGKSPEHVRQGIVNHVKALVTTPVPLRADLPLVISKGPSVGPQLIQKL